MGDRDPAPRLDLYRELEVHPDASPGTIEAAYRSLMKRSHPDLAGPDGLARAKRLNLAHDWLADPVRRATYDAARRARTAGPRDQARPATGSPGQAGVRNRPPPAGGRPVAERPSRPRPASSPPPRRQASPASSPASQRTGSPSSRWLRAGSVVGVIALLAVLGATLGGRLIGGSAGQVAVPTPTSTPFTAPSVSPSPTPLPTSTPTAVATTAPTASPMPTVAPGASPSPYALPNGRADLRFSGAYTERFAAAFDATSSCRAEQASGASALTLHGFHLASGTGSPAHWILGLDDMTGSWTMRLSVDSPTLDLYWIAGADSGSVSATASGFTFDLLMTGVSAAVRIQGAVSCG